jgi:hypothetical protein
MARIITVMNPMLRVVPVVLYRDVATGSWMTKKKIATVAMLIVMHPMLRVVPIVLNRNVATGS